MPSLYNCRHDGDQYRITKFDSDWNVEASYLCDLNACECPAGHRPHCRHREMLPKFIQREHIGDCWFYDHDRGGWVQGASKEIEEVASEALPHQQMPKLSTLDMIALTHDEVIVRQAIVNGLKLLDSLAPAGLGQASDQKPYDAFDYTTRGEIEPSPILGGFPDWCVSSGECTTPDDCILFGCAHGHGTPPREPSTSLALPLEPHSQTVTTKDFESVGDGSSPSVAAKGTIRRRV